jgi:hypothetical protein
MYVKSIEKSVALSWGNGLFIISKVKNVLTVTSDENQVI